MLEIAASAAMLAVAMALFVQLLGAVAAGRRASERRLFAIQELGNLMERASAIPWDELTTEVLRGRLASKASLGRLPDADLSASVEEGPGPRGEKRISLRLRWRERSGDWSAPVRLTAWVYRPRGG